MVRTGEDAIQVCPDIFQAREQNALNIQELLPAVVAPADARLVGHQNYQNAQPVRCRDGVGRTWNEDDVRRAVKVPNVLDNYSIAVQEQRGTGLALLRRSKDLAPDIVRVQTLTGELGGIHS
jgi:hypothetical protein